MNPSRSAYRLRRRYTGVVFLLVLALLVWLSVALYDKQFTPEAMVTLYTSSVGNEMHIGNQVMVRGVQVGEVRQISADGSGARLVLALQPAAAAQLPANTSAEMLPTTLFGERYVDLIPPASPSSARLTSGSVIRQDRSHDALELETVLNNLVPMLRAVEPEKLSLVLTALARGLQSRGAELGKTLVTLNSYLKELNPQLPALDRDIRLLAGLAKTYAKAAPDLLAALNDFSINGQTIAAQRSQVAALFTNLTAAATDLRSFLAANQSNIINLSTTSTASLSILARYAPEFPCTLQALVAFEPAMNKVLGAGTSQPGLHVNVVVVPARAAYHPGRDTPRYGDNLGPHCYSTPFPGIHLNDGTSTPTQRRGPGGAAGVASPPSRPAKAPRANGGTRLRSSVSRRASRTPAATTAALPWLANTPQQSELIRELAALELGQAPATLPGWSSLLAGPLWRGTTVTLGVRA